MPVWTVISIHTPPHSQVIVTYYKRGSPPHLHRLDKIHQPQNITIQSASLYLSQSHNKCLLVCRDSRKRMLMLSNGISIVYFTQPFSKTLSGAV